ncbi:hypothetical protein RRG08_035844 [Elysia crispata]|uniref:Uncharacterized protein n=1 Tax=Elysia crispata TaxID=231223 RepID=A0AAE0Z5H2_9GAST|nr:hypothetical protein RRG08_035844 [Elysia crispata]
MTDGFLGISSPKELFELFIVTMSEKLSAFFKGEESTVKHPRGVGFIAVMYDVKSQWRSVNAGGLRFQAQQQNNLLRRLYGMLVFRPSSTRQRVTQYEQSSAMVRENQRNAEAEIEPINRQLEAQNVLNENEENFLVEADHRRVLHDNRHNVALENGADSQRAQIENRRNVERECHNTQTRLENHRNCTQERHRYFLRQRRSMPGLNNSHGQDGLQSSLSDSQNRLPLSGSHLVETVDVRQLQGVHRREEDLLLNQF